MARGRQGSERFYRSTSVRRAASVPVGMGGDPSLSNLIKAQNISSGAMDDSGAISSASRWRDQQLLNNITNTLAATSSYNPPPSRSRYQARRSSISGAASVPRYASRRHSIAAQDIMSATTLPQTAQAFRAARLRARATSVPPVPTYAASEPPVRRAAIYSSLQAEPRRPLPTTKTFIQTDSPLFRTAGTDAVGAQSIGALRREAPGYVSRSYQLKSSPRSSSLTSVPRRPFVPRGITSSGLAVRQARQSLGRLERELGVDEGGSPYSYYDDSYAIEAPIASPIVVPTRVTSVRRASLPAIHQRYSVTGMPSVPLRSTVPPSPALSTAHSKLASIESMLDTTYEPPIQPASYTTLRSAAVEARNKMDRNKKMLDKYLPVHLGPENEVEYEVDYRYGQLADRMPQLSPYKPKSVAVTNSLVAPYRPVAKAGRDLCEVAKPPMISGRPPISDTRKRCREVLCKVKGDPRYYD